MNYAISVVFLRSHRKVSGSMDMGITVPGRAVPQHLSILDSEAGFSLIYSLPDRSLEVSEGSKLVNNNFQMAGFSLARIGPGVTCYPEPDVPVQHYVT